MAVAGTLTYKTELDTSGIQKSGSTVKSIIAGLGITKLISSAMNTIKNSTDDAIKRVDTLNNFPKVMKSLGISSKDADKSIKTLSDKLSGLPTTLDQGASAVQRFTAFNGDVKKSTDIFLAVNNAILAGGANAEAQASAMEQLTQAYTKGKPEANDWKILMQAMPAQLKQVANTMGYTSTAIGGDFYEALQKGDVSMDDFMGTIVQLNEKGGKGFDSFTKQAKVGTEGIGTSIKVAKTQVVKGIADIIKGLNDGLAQANLPSISEIISMVGKKAKEVLDVFAKNLPNIIKFMSNLYKTIVDIAPYLVTIGAIIAAWKVGKTIQSIVQGFQAAKVTLSLFTLETNGASIATGVMNGTLKLSEGLVALLTGKMTLAQLAQAGMAKAQAVLNAVMSANPIALVVVAIVALIAAFVLLWNKSEAFRNFWINLWDGIKNITSKAIEGIKNFFTGIIDFVKNNWKGLLLLIVNPFAGAFKLLYDNVGGFRKFIDDFVKNVISFFQQLPQKVGEFIRNTITFFDELPERIGFFIGQVIGYMVKFGIDAYNWVTTEVPKIIEGIITFFEELPGKIWSFLVEVTTKIYEWGKEMVNKAIEIGSKFIENTIRFYIELPGKIWNLLKMVVTNVINWGKDLVRRGKEASINLFNAIVNTIKNLPSQMFNIGKNIVQGIWNGINNAKNWILNKIKAFGRSIVKGFQSVWSIHSPSRVMKDEVGQWLPKGIAVGIEANTDSVENAMKDMYKEMDRTIKMENNKLNIDAISGNIYNKSFYQTPVSIDLNANVEMDSQKVGRLVTPSVTKTIKNGGGI